MDNVRKRIKEKGLKPSDVWKGVGVSSAAYSQWNTGKSTPTIYNIQKMADILECSVDDLLGESIPMTGFSDETEAIGVVNDPPHPKTDPSPDPDEIADLVRTFYDDAKFRALFRMKREVSQEAFDAMATLILNLKGNKE